MTKVILSAVMASVLMVGFSGCAGKSGNEQLGKMSKGQVDQQIVKGKSTKEDVKALVGDPQNTDFDQNGNEKWVYAFARSSQKAVNYIPVANWFVRGTNDTKKTLVVLFDDKGIVKNYIASESEGETKGGLFQ